MSEFIPWNSQPLEDWAAKYAKGKFIDLEGRKTHYLEKGEEMHRILDKSRLKIFDQAGLMPRYECSEEFNKLALEFLQN